MAEIVARKNEIVKSFRSGIEDQVESNANLTLYRGHGRFTGPHEIEVNGEALASDKIFINTGTRPRILPIPGLDQVAYLTNRNIMELDAVPAHLIALGGNYLGLEFGQMFRRFGSEVTVVELNDQIVPREDPEISASLKDALEQEGMNFRLGARTTKIVKTTGGVEVTIEQKKRYQRDAQGLASSRLCRADAKFGRSRARPGRDRDRSGRLHQAHRKTGDQRARRVGAGRRQRRARLHPCFV